MKRREEIFNEVIELYRKGTTFMFIDITDGIQFNIAIQPFYAIMDGCAWNWKTEEETETRKVAKTGDFEDDLYYLIDLLVEDAKVAQIV